MVEGSSVKQTTRNEKAYLWLILILLGIVLIRTAWISDDALITFRTVLNFTHGFGPTFNVTERVQAYTHPLWFLVVSLGYLVSGNIFYTAIVLSILFTLLAVWLLIFRLSHSQEWAILAGIALLFSKAFIDYATSGLENPLSYLLLILFVVTCITKPGGPGTGPFAPVFLLSLIVLSRPDLTLMVLPMLFVVYYRARRIRPMVTGTILGFLPLIAWLLFSTVYYGFPMPNTAYAKLGTGIPRKELLMQGLQYFLDSLDRDPLTLTVIAFVSIRSMIHDATLDRSLALGIVVYILYILAIGGDFMSGRLFSVPVFAAAIILSRSPAVSTRQFVLFGLTLIMIGMAASPVTLFSGSEYDNRSISSAGITDERGFYYQQWGLLSGNRNRFLEFPEWPSVQGEPLDVVVDVKVRCNQLGQAGLYAGPSVHLVDTCGLTDPLLARLPAQYDPNWRVGHYVRMIPEGYVESIRSSEIRFSDDNLQRYYEKLQVLTRVPLFSVVRLRTIIAMNVGHYDYLIDRARYRSLPEPISVKPDQLATVRSEGSIWNAPGHIVFGKQTPLTVDYTDVQTNTSTLDVTFDNNDRYRIDFIKDGTPVGSVQVGPKPGSASGLARYTVEMPQRITTVGFNRLVIRPVDGDGRYSIGHLLAEE